MLVNPAFARAVCEKGDGVCACGAGAGTGQSETQRAAAAKRYHGSQDYNAGRHAAEVSALKANCPLWRPPNAGHLHSWRRGFTQPAVAA